MLINFLCFLAHILVVRILRWEISGERPVEQKVMILGAPHTSNLDYFLTLALIHHYKLPLRYLIKNNIFKGPMAPLLKSLGGIPVDRNKSNRLVTNIIRTIQEQDEIAMGVLPEGTRKYVDYWKSGFYYIAEGAGVPIYPILVDGARKRLLMGPKLVTTGDIEADVAILAKFFGDTKGVIPENSGPVRVKPPRERTEKEPT